MNHIMPKAVALALACGLTLPLAACGGDSGSAAPDNVQSVGESDPGLAEGQEVRLE